MTAPLMRQAGTVPLVVKLENRSTQEHQYRGQDIKAPHT